jgi:hypothetical protein
VASKSQIRATSTHRRRAAARGLVRVEVQAAKGDAGLIRAVAETLRSKSEKAKALRSTLEKALVDSEVKTALSRRRFALAFLPVRDGFPAPDKTG